MSGHLIVISAPSGAGKTTLCQRLLAEFPQLVLSISTTTRAPRGMEKDGVAYFFVSKAMFEAQIAAGQFAEWAQVHGNYYGTSKKVIQDSFALGKSVLLDIDVQGAASLAQSFPKETLRVFIAPPSMEVLEMRLRTRGTDSDDTIQKRLRNARNEMARKDEFDHIVINDDFEQSYAELSSIVGPRLEARNPNG